MRSPYVPELRLRRPQKKRGEVTGEAGGGRGARRRGWWGASRRGRKAKEK